MKPYIFMYIEWFIKNTSCLYTFFFQGPLTQFLPTCLRKT
jgi:hypothetical protein